MESESDTPLELDDDEPIAAPARPEVAAAPSSDAAPASSDEGEPPSEGGNDDEALGEGSEDNGDEAPSEGDDDEAPGASSAERLRASVRGAVSALEALCEELVERVAALESELEDQQLIHDTVVQHSTDLENELSATNDQLTRTHEVIREDMVVAAQVQLALAPRLLADMEYELEIAVHNQQLTDVGGDYYDFFRLPNDRYGIGVFDISGHGVSAALIMAFLKAQFAQVTEFLDTPQGIVEWVNKAAFEFLREIRRYATVNFVAVEERSIRYVSGGGYGMVLRNGKAEVFNKRNHFLGLRLKPYQEFQLPFEVGDLLVMYTDGIVEATNAEGLDYSAHRLNELIAQNADKPVQELLDLCLADYRAYRVEDSDDLTLIIARRKA